MGDAKEKTLLLTAELMGSPAAAVSSLPGRTQHFPWLKINGSSSISTAQLNAVDATGSYTDSNISGQCILPSSCSHITLQLNLSERILYLSSCIQIICFKFTWNTKACVSTAW